MWYTINQIAENPSLIPATGGIIKIKYAREATNKLLAVGYSKDISNRAIKGLIKKTLPHSTRENFDDNNLNYDDILVCWEVVDKYEKERKKIWDEHKAKYGHRPSYYELN